MLILDLISLRGEPVLQPLPLRAFILPFVTIVATSVCAQTPPQPILITADLTDAPRKLIHADMEIPVVPGPVTLTAAKWIPGTHRPSGPIDNITGLVVRADGKELPWRRDDLDLYAFHIDVPPRVSRLNIHVDFLAVAGNTVSSDDGSTSGVQTTMEWEEVLLYPRRHAGKRHSGRSLSQAARGLETGYSPYSHRDRRNHDAFCPDDNLHA